MKKTITINLNGTVFQIDEDAYSVLDHYLNAVSEHLKNEDAQAEIMNDIEARIAELLTERMNRSGQVITIQLVEEVTNIMGKPSDYGEEQELTDDAQQSEKQSSQTAQPRTAKRLYRDPENAIVGGILSGLAIYLNIDALWLRIGFIILMFAGIGTVIPVYLILWIIIPKAETTTQRMEMHGIDVTIDNLKAEAMKMKDRVTNYVKSDDFGKKKEQLKSDAYRIRDNVERYISSPAFKSGVNEVGNTSTRIIKGVVKAGVAFVSGIIGLVGIIVVFSLLVILVVALINPAYMTDLQLNHFQFPGSVLYNYSSGQIIASIIALLLIIGIPVQMLFLGAIKLLSGREHFSRTTIWVSVLLWLAGIFLLISVSTRFAFTQWLSMLN